jgi:hypothetical protein
MTALESVDGAGVLRQFLAEGQSDVLRTMVTVFANALMSVDADAICGAEYGQCSDDRTNRRNGYRAEEWDTRAGTVELQLGVTKLSKSQVSEMAQHLDAQVEAFRSWPLDSAHYTLVAVDALSMKVREDGRTINVACLVAVGVNAEGYCEVLGLGRRLRRGRRRLAGVPALTLRPRPQRRADGHLRRLPRPGQRPWPPPCPTRRGKGVAPTSCALCSRACPRALSRG